MTRPPYWTRSMLTPLVLAMLTLLLLTLPLRSACAACEKSDPDTGLICGDDVPDYPGWRALCAEGCVLYTVVDAALAQSDARRARLVPQLRLERDAAIGAGRRIEAELSESRAFGTALQAEIDRLREEAASRWSPVTWLGLGAGGAFAVGVGLVIVGVLL